MKKNLVALAVKVDRIKWENQIVLKFSIYAVSVLKSNGWLQWFRSKGGLTRLYRKVNPVTL